MRLSDDLRWFIVDDELSLSVRDSEIVDHWPTYAKDDLFDASDVDSLWPFHVRRVRCRVGFYEFSIVWGTGTYSSNTLLTFTREPLPFTETPATVEVMIFEGDGRTPFEGEPIGQVDAVQLRALVEGFTASLTDDQLHELRREL